MLIDAYNDVMASERLSGVKVKWYGDPSTLTSPGANPRVIWVPTKDTFGPPDTLFRQEAFVNGARVIETSRWCRFAGCDVYLFTDFASQDRGLRAMEQLINEFQMALYEVIGAPGPNYQIGTAQWFSRNDIFTDSIMVVQPLVVAVPIWSAQPAQLLGTVDTMGSRRSTPLPATPEE